MNATTPSGSRFTRVLAPLAWPAVWAAGGLALFAAALHLFPDTHAWVFGAMVVTAALLKATTESPIPWMTAATLSMTAAALGGLGLVWMELILPPYALALIWATHQRSGHRTK